MWKFFRRLLNARSQGSAVLVARCVEGRDGKHRLTIRQRGDHFTWDTDELREPDEFERQYFPEPYWRPGIAGGIFSSAEEAETDARMSLPWLKLEREDRDDG